MSSSSSSSASLNFQVSDNYSSTQIKEIRVYDRQAARLQLSMIEGRHCFCVIELNDDHNTQYRLEAGSDENKQMGVSYTQYVPDKKVKQVLITKVKLRTYFQFKDLGKKLRQWYLGSNYDPITNNCYHVAERILQYLGFDKQFKQVQKKRKSTTTTGVGNAFCTIGTVAFVIFGAAECVMTGNLTPLIQMAKDSTTIISLLRIGGIGVSKILRQITN